jgi:protein required for attachment to host cells
MAPIAFGNTTPLSATALELNYSSHSKGEKPVHSDSESEPDQEQIYRYSRYASDGEEELDRCALL